jgi:hypothetical protein
VFRTKAKIGEVVRQGQESAEIDSMALTAPLDGALRGLTSPDRRGSAGGHSRSRR